MKYTIDVCLGDEDSQTYKAETDCPYKAAILGLADALKDFGQLRTNNVRTGIVLNGINVHDDQLDLRLEVWPGEVTEVTG